jgi:flagellar assembly protein FliH
MSVSRHQAVGAYQRWEPPAFDPAARAPDASGAPDAPGHAAAADAGPVPPEAPPQPAIRFPTADEIETMYEQARTEGQATGYAEGTAQARDEAARLAALAQGLDQALVRLDEDIAEEILALAIEVARRMVRLTLAERPAAVAETVKAALQQLPQNQVRIHLHPDDIALVRAHLADPLEHGHHRLLEDDTVTRGGCRLDAGGSDIDATVETRWRRILEGLAVSHTAWREHD